jgi:hypothetical protein
MSRLFISSEVSHTSRTVQLSTGTEVDLKLTWRVAVSPYTEAHGERMRDVEPELIDWEMLPPSALTLMPRSASLMRWSGAWLDQWAGEVEL